ncbi:Uncharacterised protein [Streptococcus pneumoniae]|nr:Uncharacterised protein [Streptococcus pneumoniae]
MLFQVHNHLKLLLVHFSKCGKKRILYLSYKSFPYFIINQKYAISGAQPLETFVGALQQVWEEENPVPKLQELSSEGGSDMSCTDESCSVPSKEQ